MLPLRVDWQRPHVPLGWENQPAAEFDLSGGEDCINIDEVAGSGSERGVGENTLFNKSTKKHGCCGRLDEDQQGVNDREKPMRFAALAEEPLCKHCHSCQGRGPVRFILWGLETCRRANC